MELIFALQVSLSWLPVTDDKEEVKRCARHAREEDVDAKVGNISHLEEKSTILQLSRTLIHIQTNLLFSNLTQNGDGSKVTSFLKGQADVTLVIMPLPFDIYSKLQQTQDA